MGFALPFWPGLMSSVLGVFLPPFLPPFQFKLAPISSLTFKSHLFLNKERTGGGHWGGRPHHSCSVRGPIPRGAGSWAPSDRSGEEPAFLAGLGDLEPPGMI